MLTQGKYVSEILLGNVCLIGFNKCIMLYSMLNQCVFNIVSFDLENGQARPYLE